MSPREVHTRRTNAKWVNPEAVLLRPGAGALSLKAERTMRMLGIVCDSEMNIAHFIWKVDMSLIQY
jgi:hypothetical protein